ncbi:MAG: glycosyltransferase involved in cell wall biosynthesis, partial [Patiriisocius sp.]
MSNPFVSIILPVYNGEKYLSKSIESCLNQTYRNIELIIVNDCSTDKTLEIVDGYLKLDSRIKVLTNSANKRLPASLNIGHLQAQGDYITWTSDDNLYLP